MKFVSVMTLFMIGMIAAQNGCPDYEKRDQFGQCRRFTCNYNQVLERDGVRQGECRDCNQGTIPDRLGQSCQYCQQGQTATTITNTQGQLELTCSYTTQPTQPQCGSRGYLNDFGQCQTCPDYQCPPTQGSGFRQDQCQVPYCQPGSITRRDCGCEYCQPGTTPDLQGRTCVQTAVAPISCPEWTRQQFDGQCASDRCYYGQTLVRTGVDQGKCIQCSAGEQSRSDFRGCSRVISCGPNEQLDSTGSFCVPVGCPQYTRTQISGNCAPDNCPSNSYNVRVDTYDQRGQALEQGKCVPCGQGQVGSSPDPQNYRARTSCQQQACSGNQITTSNGTCQTCGQCQQPNFQRTFCVSQQCYGNEILRNFGTGSGSASGCVCEPCSGKSVPNSERSACVACPQDSYITEWGECLKCDNYPRESQSSDGLRCVGKACGARQFLNFNGDCQNCGAYQVSDGTRCYEPACDDRSIVSPQGQVENCPAYSRMVKDDDGNDCRECGESTCKDREYLSSDGFCYDCQDFTVPDPSRRECIKPQCPETSAITREGTCRPCERGTNPDQSQTQCVEVQCGPRQRIVESEGVTTCVECEIGTRAQEENTVCRADECEESTKKFTRDDGICQTCTAFRIVNDDRTECVYPTCEDNEIVTEEGECEECPLYEKRIDRGDQFNVASRYQCQACSCDSSFSREYCLPNGDCDTCPDFQVPTEDGKACRRPTCDQLVNKDGSCGLCEDWNYYDEDADECKPRECKARERVTRNGECVECPAFFKVTENKRDCQECNCGPRSICQEDGTCKECPDYFIVSTSGESQGTCVKAPCENGVLQKDGSCEVCKQCEQLNEAKTECVKPTCSKREVLSFEGKCNECEKFSGPALIDGDQCGATCQTCRASGRQYIREDGECETCPDYSRISDDRQKCAPPPCVGNSIVTTDGYCWPCQDYTRADSEKRKCLPTQCLENEILKRDGSCSACPKYQRSDPMGRYCMQSACNNTEFYDDKGYCQKCGSCSRSSLENLRLKCFADECGANQILLNDGRCQNCQPYTRPTSTDESDGKCGQVCKEVQCAENEIVLEDGSCQACPDWTMPQQLARVCGPMICSAREQLLRNGRCKECSEYTRGGGSMEKQQYIQCKPDVCADNQILTRDGTCAFCGPYETAAENGKECVVPSCGDRTAKLLMDASFEKCPKFSRATENCRQCSPDPCNLRQKLLENGKCEDCEPYMRATPDGKNCRRPQCEKNQILKVDGTCQDCPPFMKKGPGGRQCVEVICSQTERLLPSGECETCEAYSRAINDGKACAPNLCTQRQKILQDGTCEDCPNYTRSTSDHKGCASQVCTARQILQIDGRCAECYPYTRADAKGQTCVPHNCNDRQKLGPDGSCVDCPDFERAQGTGLTCGPDSCNIRQRIQRDGTCVYCELYHAVCTNRRCCTKPTCKPMVEYITMDGVCGSCPFHQQTGRDGLSCTTDPTKKLPDPQIMAPTPVALQSAPAAVMAPATGYDVWTDEQFLSEERSTGFYLNQQTGNWGFILGSALRFSSAIAGLGACLLIISTEL